MANNPPDSTPESMLAQIGEALAARGVPLDEVLALARAAAAAAVADLGAGDDGRTARALDEAERKRSQALAGIWNECGDGGCGPTGLTGQGQAGFAPGLTGIAGLIGTSAAMRQVRAAATAAAAGSHPLLLVGPPGTGKEFVARAIHHRRGWGRFDSIDCARLTADRADDDLFALVGRGGPTDVGMVFLDEVTELAPDLQARLLTALEASSRVAVAPGEAALIVLATRWDPGLAIEQRRLRPGLARLLRSATLGLPPLRDRAEDIRLLTEHFLGSFCARRCGCIRGVTAEALEALEAWGWPGNVRELRDAVRHAVATGAEGTIDRSDLPESVLGTAAAPPVAAASTPGVTTLAEIERGIVRQTLVRFAGNKSRTAKALGISRHKLYDVLRGDGGALETA